MATKLSWDDPNFTDSQKLEQIALRKGWRLCLSCTVGDYRWPEPHLHSPSNEPMFRSNLPDWLHDDGLAFAEVFLLLQKICGRITIHRGGVLDILTDAKHPNLCGYWEYKLDLPQKRLDANALCHALYDLKQVPDVQVRGFFPWAFSQVARPNPLPSWASLER